MITTRSLLIAAAAVMTGAMMTASPVFAADESATTKTETKVEQKSDGSMEQKKTMSSESVDTSGTKTTEDSKAKEKMDANGDGTKTMETTTTNDPKGLMNETKTTAETKVETKDGKTRVHHEKKVNGKTVESTDTEAKPNVAK